MLLFDRVCRRQCEPAYLKILRPDRGHVCDSENKTYCIEDIRLPAAVQAGDGVEALVPRLVNNADSPRRGVETYHPDITVRTA